MTGGSLAGCALAAALGGLQRHAQVSRARRSTTSRRGSIAAARDSARPDATARATTASRCPDSQAASHGDALGLQAQDRAARTASVRSTVLPPQVERAHRARRHAALAGGQRQSRGRSGRWSSEFWQELGFLIDVELPDAGVMETDWAENRAKIATGVHAQLPRQAARQRLLDRRARQVPHPRSSAAPNPAPPRSTSATAAWRRCSHGSGVDSEEHRVAAAAARSRTRSRDAAPPDGAPRRRSRSAPRRRSRGRPAGPRAHALTKSQDGVPCCRSTTSSTAPGGASASRSTASASRSRTATARRACISCATSTPTPTIRPQQDEGLLRQAQSFWQVGRKPAPSEQYRIQVKDVGRDKRGQRAEQGRRGRENPTRRPASLRCSTSS